jgi:GH43 family beta-xylosidase
VPFAEVARPARTSDACPAPPLRRTFANPVAPEGADPWVLRWRGAYYYCRSRRGRIEVSRSDRLHDVCRAPALPVWEPPAGLRLRHHLWAPELHHLDGRFYVYVAADDGRNHTHRMLVLEGDALDPQRPFSRKAQLAHPDDRWAIDGTVLAMDDGRRYLLWSGWEGETDVEQGLYAALLANPWTIAGERHRISRPEHAWEANARPAVNEGPSVLRNPAGQVFVVYSAAASWTDEYCLGLLTLVGDDPLRPECWRKSPSPVFRRSALVHGPGHASFVKSPDGSEDWIVYHAACHSGAGWKRDVRMQRFGWQPDGSPDFGRPVPTGVALELPAGTGP